jgi:rubrerythrin
LNNERRVKKLYKLYSIKFPEYKKVWGKLIPEEDEHVRLLKNLKVKFGENNKYFDVNEYSMGVLEYVSSFVEDELIKIKERKVEIKEALEAALSLEQSMAERKSFEMFNPSDLEIKKVFNKINRETKKHKKIILNIKTAINNRGFYIDRKTVIIFISQAFKNGK